MAEIGPAPRLVPCSACGTPVDALRAPRVRCIDGELLFFCSSEHADGFDVSAVRAPGSLSSRSGTGPATERSHELWTPEPPGSLGMGSLGMGNARSAPAEPGRTPPDSDAAAPHVSAADVPPLTPSVPAAAPMGAAPPTARSGSASAPRAEEPESALPSEFALQGSRRTRIPQGGQPSQDFLLLGIATVSGLFGLLLGLGGSGDAVRLARLVVVGAGCGVLVAHAALSRSPDARQLDRISTLAGPVVALLTALLAHVLDHAEFGRALTTSGALVAAAALLPLLVQRATEPVDEARLALSDDLAVRARRLSGPLTEYCAAEELRPGEEVLVQTGEVVPADGTVVAGEAQVLPWRGCPRQEQRTEGDPVVAGARILDGALRVVTGWTGADRAWLRLVADRRRRADLHSSIARVAHGVAQRGSLGAAALVLLTGFALGADGLSVVLAGAATHAAFAHAGVAELAAARMVRAVLEALDHGIAFHAAEHLDAAGSVTIAALCARGTVLLGEPEVTGIEPLEQQPPEELLALAAGAESAVYHPVATAVLRAARARGIRPDATRNHNPVAGLGVTAVTSNGRGLVVGSRALMLREKISVARAEQRITELESLGRSALLVAVDGHLCGILALQDGLRSGARAAVQHLLDLGVEPVLLSGDSRETTDAIARNIDIEHVRPELPAAQRGDEVRQLSEGGAVVAVVGRSPVDDIALGAADVSIALRATAASNADFGVGLASDDVRDAARAIRIARKARDGARTVLALAVVPATLAGLAIAFGLVGPAVAPAAALLGTLAALLRSRED